MRCTALTLMPTVLAIAGAVQCVASWRGALVTQQCRVSATTRSAISRPSGGTREGRVLSRSNPSTPSCDEALLPTPNRCLALAGARAHDLDRAETIPAQKDDPCPPHVFLPAVPVRNDRFETSTVGGTPRRIPGRCARLAHNVRGTNLHFGSEYFDPEAGDNAVIALIIVAPIIENMMERVVTLEPIEEAPRQDPPVMKAVMQDRVGRIADHHAGSESGAVRKPSDQDRR